jgi:hypothetical protein
VPKIIGWLEVLIYGVRGSANTNNYIYLRAHVSYLRNIKACLGLHIFFVISLLLLVSIISLLSSIVSRKTGAMYPKAFILVSVIVLTVMGSATTTIAHGRTYGVNNRHSFMKRQNQSTPGIPITQFATLPLDHFGREFRTFKNRYWIKDDAYKPGGPVICTYINSFLFSNLLMLTPSSV